MCCGEMSLALMSKCSLKSPNTVSLSLSFKPPIFALISAVAAGVINSLFFTSTFLTCESGLVVVLLMPVFFYVCILSVISFGSSVFVSISGSIPKSIFIA